MTNITPYVHKAETEWGNVSLGTIKFKRALKVEDHVNAINLMGKITDLDETDTKLGYMQLYSENIRLYSRAHVNIQNAFLFANDTIALYNGAEMESTIKFDCANDDNKDMYQCMNFDLN